MGPLGAFAGAFAPGEGALPAPFGPLAAKADKVFGSTAAKPFARTVMPAPKGGGRAFKLPSRPQALAPPQVSVHLGFSHCPGLHFHVHCGSEHLLSQLSEHSVVHLGGAQTVLQPGQPPCSQCCVGQTMAHFGASHRWRQVAKLICAQAVSHCGGAQTGSQVSSQSALPQVQEHLGWQSPPAPGAPPLWSWLACRMPVPARLEAKTGVGPPLAPKIGCFWPYICAFDTS